MAKGKQQSNERRAIAERMRQEQARKERMRGLLILGVAVLVVVGLLAAALVPYLKHQRQQAAVEKQTLPKLGVTEAAAKCQPEVSKPATGNNVHVNPPEVIKYPDAPPAFGRHWGNFLMGSEIRNFYSTSDRPQVERLVHSLEHGHTLIWYDDTIKPGTRAYSDLQKIAEKVPGSAYLMIVPWKSSDGAAFPQGAHIAITHWTGPQHQQGKWRYCDAPSGQVVADFMKQYPKSDAPEPGAA